MSSALKKGIGDLLVQKQLVNHAQLEEARKEQKISGGKLSTALVKLGYIKSEQMSEFLSKQYGVPYIDLDDFEIDADALKSIPPEACAKHVVIPVSRAGNTLVVAFADPSNIFVRDDLAFISKCKIEVVVAQEPSILKAIEKYHGSSKGNMNNVENDLENSEEAFSFVNSLAAQMIEGADGDSGPMVKYVNLMLGEAIKMKASDIHIEPYEKRLRVRYRIDGMLQEKSQPPSGVAATLSSRIKIMARLDISERRRPQDGRIKVRDQKGQDVDLRVSVMPTMFGEKIVMRLLDKSNLKLDMTQLGFDQADLDLFKNKIGQPQGLVLVTGPTGSGKTTTLYSALQSLNAPDVNVSTAEDPVEFNLDGINQVQVNPAIEFTFADALRSFLRQDPDIILVGEIRDLETAEVAFKAASTGHLVLSTLHTNDAPATISRLMDMGVAGYLITSTVTLIVAQRLTGRICKDCKVPQRLEDTVLLSAGVKPDRLAEFTGTCRGEGCTTCNGTGIKGRVAVYEVMVMSNPLREIILTGGSPVEIKRAAIRGGMRSLRQAALEKVRDGQISIDSALGATLGDDEVL